MRLNSTQPKESTSNLNEKQTNSSQLEQITPTIKHLNKIISEAESNGAPINEKTDSSWSGWGSNLFKQAQAVTTLHLSNTLEQAKNLAEESSHLMQNVNVSKLGFNDSIYNFYNKAQISLE